MDRLDVRFLDRILDMASNGIYVYDLLKGNNIYINQQYTELLGYTMEEINALSQEEFFDLFHPEDQQRIADHMHEVINSNMGDVFEIEYRFKRKDGTWVWCLSRDAIFDTDHKANTTQFLGCFMDITQRKNAEEALRVKNHDLKAKNKELEQITYVTSHDLQEPLRTLTGMSKHLQENYVGVLGDDGDQCLSYIREAGDRMSSLITALLDHSRIGQKKTLSNVDVLQLTLGIIQDLDAMIRESEATIEIGNLPTLKGYETELRLVIQNLLANAIKFRKYGVPPKIKFSASKEGRSWRFAIRDNGIGMKQEHLGRIFQIFQRLHRNSKFEGTGIGLAHCRKIVEMHGGRIWAESTFNEGSTFYFTIPTRIS